MNQPQACYDIGCPLAGKSKGFALWSGDLSQAKICILLETPAETEIGFRVKDLDDGERELTRRRESYPKLDNVFVRMGAPVVGRAGQTLWWWMMKPSGLQRSEVGIFNTLHCFPGKKLDGTIAYPAGDIRKKAEACCSTLWLEELRKWNPTISISCLHPAGLARQIAPLPMALRAIERAKLFASRGERVLILMGGKAVKMWMGYGESVTKFVAHWQDETEFTNGLREKRRLGGLELKEKQGCMPRKPRK